MKILVIIPCYNEEENIVKTVNNIKKQKLDYIVINDGSTDNSLEVLKSNNINYINMPNNVGIGGVMQTGYKYALRNNYDIAIQFDGDGQHDAAYIKKIVEPIENKKANLVIGSRFVGNESEFKSTKMRRVGIGLLSFLLKIMTKKTIKDITSGFRAADKKVIEYFSNNYPYEYPEPVTNLALAKHNCKIEEVPVKMNEREHGTSSITKFKSIYYMVNVIILFFIVLISKGDDFNA